jgi:hypothetical protein
MAHDAAHAVPTSTCGAPGAPNTTRRESRARSAQMRSCGPGHASPWSLRTP